MSRLRVGAWAIGLGQGFAPDEERSRGKTMIVRHPPRPANRVLTGGITPNLEMIGFALMTACVVFMATAAYQGYWLVDVRGEPIATDFVNVYAAGRLALEGKAAAAYDWTVHKQTEISVIGHDFGGYFGWHYPPTFLFAATPLALLPLISAALVWLVITSAAYIAAIHGIVRLRAATLLAAGFPGVVWNFVAGQNGLLTAALIGGALLLVERRPVASGILLGLLTYKPQFGILFPLALALDGRWRIIGIAAGTALALAAVSLLSFGSDSWHDFIAGMPSMSQAVFVEGRVGLNKLQTVLGVVRWLGGSMMFAWTLQGALIVACLVAVAITWRSRTCFEVKAATLATAALLATPYLFIYDFAVLAIPMAFIFRIGSRDGFLKLEVSGFAAASLLVLAAPIVAAPTGLLAALIVAALIGRRALTDRESVASHSLTASADRPARMTREQH
jgi:arabinofuranan 3-O-arabinosyltransferase